MDPSQRARDPSLSPFRQISNSAILWQLDTTSNVTESYIDHHHSLGYKRREFAATHVFRRRNSSLSGWGGKREGAGRKPKSVTTFRPLAIDTELRWYAVRTDAAQEFTAWRGIADLGFETLFPREIRPGRPESHTATGRTIPAKPTVIAPLFRTYLFARFSAANPSWRYIPHLRGVAEIFGISPDAPTPVPDAAMAVVRAQLDGQDILIVQGATPVPSGHPVRIVGGAFDGLLGLAGQSSAERVSVILDLLGRSTVASIPRRNVALLLDKVSLSGQAQHQAAQISTL